jgi:hypothetical protein
VLAATACDFERLRREHEEAAGEERNQREHIQIHSIGARQVRTALLHGIDRGDMRTRRKKRCDPCLQLHAIRARAQVAGRRGSARRAGRVATAPCDVRQRCDAAQARCRQYAAYLELDRREAGDDPQLRALRERERLGRLGGKEDTTSGLSSSKRRAGSSAKSAGWICAARSASIPTSRIAPLPSQARLCFEYRARDRDALEPREHG